jgi:hypothetical protein
MTPDQTQAAQARAIAARAPAALRDLTHQMLADMDRVDPGRRRLADDAEAEVDAVVAHANATSWHFAITRAAGDLLGLGPEEADAHPAVPLADAMVLDPAPGPG